MKTPASSMALILLASFIGSFGMVCLKAGAGRLHRNIESLIFNYRLAAGVALFLISSYFFVLGMRKGELTILYPMMSLGYLWTLVWSRVFFGEPLTRHKFVGIGLILSGILVLFAGNR